MVIKKLKRLLAKYTETCFGNSDYERFVIITSPRTGSNLLVSLLSSHRSIHAYGELFNYIKNRSCREIWGETFSKKLFYVKKVGFKIFYDHPLASQDKEVWDLIKADNNIKIIHLTRNNLIRSHLSLLIAYKTNIWGLTPTMGDVPLTNRKVKVDVKNFIENMERIIQYRNETNVNFSKHPIIEITYEELVADQQRTMSKVFDFLEVKTIKTSSYLRKQNSEPIKELVSNYNELRKGLQDTKFEQYLNDDLT